MSEPAPSIRVKLPCKDKIELALFAPTLAAKGVVAAARTVRPVGTRLRIKMELASGDVAISGEAVVVRHVGSGPKQGMLLHLTRLDPSSFQFPLAARAPSSDPNLAAVALPAPAPRPASPQVPSAPAPMPAPIPSAPPRGLDVAALLDDGSPNLLELSRPAPALSPPVPSPEPQPMEDLDIEFADADPPPRPRRRLGLIAGVGAAAALALAAGGWLLHNSLASDAVGQALATADERIADGRLVGPSGDEALDHLIRARRLDPADPRVAQRLRALADKFEELGDRALARGDRAEAAAHFQAAVSAEPQRAAAAQKLKDVEAQVRAGSQGLVRPVP